MKKVTLILGLLVFIGCHSSNSNEGGTQGKSGANVEQSQDQGSIPVVVEFLKWYKKNYKSVNSINLVNNNGTGGDPKKFYSVNFKATEKYLDLLRSSGFLSDKYLDKQKKYFAEREKYFTTHPQNEGPPEGFDYDLVLLTQDVDSALVKIDLPKLLSVDDNENTSIVKINILIKRTFYLSLDKDRWLIDNIEEMNTGNGGN